jgi:hypothetical protein
MKLQQIKDEFLEQYDKLVEHLGVDVADVDLNDWEANEDVVKAIYDYLNTTKVTAAVNAHPEDWKTLMSGYTFFSLTLSKGKKVFVLPDQNTKGEADSLLIYKAFELLNA